MTSTSITRDAPARVRAATSLPLRTRVQVAEQAINPLFEAARPLLQLLADTPAELGGNAVEQRHQWLEHEVRLFEQVCAELQIRPDHLQNARYCLCVAHDEAAMQTSWGKGTTTGTDWSTRSLAVAFGHDRQGGDRVFRLIDQTMRSPHEHFDLLEVIQNIFDLGFKGRYRFEAAGWPKLQAIRRKVRDALMNHGWNMHGQDARSGLTGPALRWHVGPWVRPAPTRKTRVLLSIGLLCAVVLGATGYAVGERLIQEAHRKDHVSPVDALAGNLNERLRSEIAAGTLSLEENPGHTALVMRFGDMFAPGQTDVNAWVGPVVATVGREIAGTSGKVLVTGYADSIANGKSRRLSNQALSEARAKQVVQILLAAGVPSARIDFSGRGDAEPIADNDTPGGRSINRRVEVRVSE